MLSPSESRIAEIIVNDFEFAVNASIIELAERAEVSPPTVTRFCRRLGCESFSDLLPKQSAAAHPIRSPIGPGRHVVLGAAKTVAMASLRV